MAITEALHFHSNAMVPVAYLKGEGSQQHPPPQKKKCIFLKVKKNLKGEGCSHFVLREHL